jgi:hypothetical protein
VAKEQDGRKQPSIDLFFLNLPSPCMSSAKKTRTFTTNEAISRLSQVVHSKAVNFYSMYSSVLGGIVTDPALMVLPLDDHMVHRGHAVFDTATLTHGMLYQLDPHLDRLLRSREHSSDKSFWTPPLLAANATARFVTGSQPDLGALP